MKLAVVLVLVAAVSGNLELEEGDDCGPDDNWNCVPFEDCLSAQQNLKKGIAPETCTYTEFRTIVCCEPDAFMRGAEKEKPTTPPPGPSKPKSDWTVSETMCAKYAESVMELQDDPTYGPGGHQHLVDNCAWKAQPLVSGGVDANQMEYPHMVQIGYGSAPNEEYLCGGSLISERWVVSAAHCSKAEKKTETGTRVLVPRVVRMGDVAPNDDSDFVKPIKVNIIERIDYPQYKPSRKYHDIALYKLESDVKFTPHIRPICLQVDDPVATSQQNPPTAIGFGDVGHGISLPEMRLQKVNLTIISTQLCSKSFGVGSDLPTGISGDTMICAGDSGTTGKDTCHGDSGASLQIRLKWPYCMHSLIGVTSFGKSVCGSEDSAGVYAKVSHYVSWIEDIVWPAEKAKWKVDKMNKATNVHFPSS